jgi:hypothetical protein
MKTSARRTDHLQLEGLSGALRCWRAIVAVCGHAFDECPLPSSASRSLYEN